MLLFPAYYIVFTPLHQILVIYFVIMMLMIAEKLENQATYNMEILEFLCRIQGKSRVKVDGIIEEEIIINQFL